jgi:ribonuclease J
MSLYFAYGTNMHPEQMKTRCPNATPLGGATLRGHKLFFTTDGLPSIAPQPNTTLYGVLWRITPEDEQALDIYESVQSGLYTKARLPIHFKDNPPRDALVYIAANKTKGDHADQEMLDEILAGAKWASLPGDYMNYLKDHFQTDTNLKLCIHRGSKEIGGSCVELSSQGKRLIIDLGLPLDAEQDHKQYLPDIPGLDGSDPNLLGILISHPHLDHFGLLSHISSKIPIGMGAAGRRILAAATPFLRDAWPVPTHGWDFESEQPIDIGPFRITPYLVDHSAYDAYAFLIESGGKRIFYSGDFRAHGRKAALFDRLIAHPPKNIDALLLEGSSIGRINDDQPFPSETDIEQQLTEQFSATTGMALVHTSAQNIDRLVSIMRASKRTGRKLVIDLYTAAILEATGNPNIPQSDWPDIAVYIPHRQRIQILNNKWFDLLKRHSKNRVFIEQLSEAPEKSTLLFRPLHCRDLEQRNCLEGTAYIYSQWEGYWERDSYGELKKWLTKHNIPKHSIHTSGHASPLDLKKLVSALNPRKVIPIHSFAPEHYSELFPNVETCNDGAWTTV